MREDFLPAPHIANSTLRNIHSIAELWQLQQKSGSMHCKKAMSFHPIPVARRSHKQYRAVHRQRKGRRPANVPACESSVLPVLQLWWSDAQEVAVNPNLRGQAAPSIQAKKNESHHRHYAFGNELNREARYEPLFLEERFRNPTRYLQQAHQYGEVLIAQTTTHGFVVLFLDFAKLRQIERIRTFQCQA